MRDATNDVQAQLKALRLNGMATAWADLTEQGGDTTLAASRWLVEHLLQAEDADRAMRSIAHQMKSARFPMHRDLAGIDFAVSQVDQQLIKKLADLTFTQDAQNVVLVGAQGLGKTMLAKNIAHAAVMGGYSAIFITAADLLLDLASQESSRALARRVKHYARVACLCIDEIGYLEYEQRAEDLLFQIVSKRYESKSLVLTTNKSFSEWSTIFPGAACATALVDRVVHHADVILIEGKSYRLRESTQSEQTSAAKRTPTKKK